jgi:hypothetical protein
MTLGTGAVWAVRAAGMLVAVPLVAAGTLSVVTWFVTTRSVTSDTVTQPVTKLVLDSRVGDLNVRTADGADIEVTTEQHGAFATPHTSRTLEDGVLTVKGWCDSRLLGGNCSVDFVVVVPHGTAIQVSNRVGDIRVRGADAALVAESSVGDVDLVDLAAPTVTASSNTGDVTAAFAKPPTAVRIDTSVGRAIVTVPSDGTHYRVGLRSGVGDESLRMPSDPTADRTISVSSGVGDVTAATQP